MCSTHPPSPRISRRRLASLLLLSVVALAPTVGAGEVLFSRGTDEYEGRRYYWLAEWRLEITVPSDVEVEDRLEVLFGSKGEYPRELRFEAGSRRGTIRDVRRLPWEWVPVDVGPLAPGLRVVLSGRGRERVAFLAGVRVRGRSRQPLRVRPIRVAGPRQSGDGGAVWSELDGFVADAQARRIWDPRPEQPDWSRAARSARYAGIALTKVQRWLHERCLPERDPATGLFRPTGSQWNYRDTAADCYPFYVWAAYFTDRELLDTVMVDVLEAEQRLCNHLGNLPVPYDMDAGKKVEVPFDRMVFGASEYAKDGLVPIVELTGPGSPWFRRLRGIIDDLFRHARVDTPYGKIPSTNIEVSGELLQILPRLHRITGEREYLDWAHRLADHYLLPGGFVPSRLSDHGCEIVGGLGLLFAVDTRVDPERAALYRPHIEHMLDEILRRGTNSHGIIVAALQASEGPHDSVSLRDGWGYDLVGCLDHDLALGTDRYRRAVRRPLGHVLHPRYERFDWDHGSRDNVADSVEGGLYLLAREPIVEGFVWADREIATLLVDHVRADRLWDTHKLEANTVRTVLIHTMLHTRGTLLRPWQAGLELGAAPCGEGICILVRSDQPYRGRLCFDTPRHRLHMGFEEDWPRMNAVPEWFTVDPGRPEPYRVEDADRGGVLAVTGRELQEGLPLRVEPGEARRLVVTP